MEVTQGSVLLKLAATALFVALNGFFVAAEFALVKARRSRIQALADKGSAAAETVRKILGDINLYLSACQLGITIASLILGWLAEPAVASLLFSGAEALGFEVEESAGFHFFALAVALTFITILHVIIGEQVPKIWAIRKPESTSLIIGKPLRLFTLLLKPLIVFVNSLSNLVLRSVGLTEEGEHDAIHDVDELRAILRAASHAGRISSRQLAFGDNILGLVNLRVRHIMLPRVDVSYVSTRQTVEENLEIIRSSRHSRFPLADPDLDNAVGIVHAKDILVARLDGDEGLDLAGLARAIPSVPDTLLVSSLIRNLQGERTHCAMVVDEHGTTVGMVFLEDALEEIVGPLPDEFDEEGPLIHETSGSTIEMAGSLSLPEAAKHLDLDMGTEEDTVAGFVVSRFGRIPKSGDSLDLPPYRIRILAMSKRRVARVSFENLDEEPAPE
ncbi:MAG: hemolysin family protein [Thermoanaerobaculia bacterium]|nr:hemolysin family protein [Thermoanaerobaculia bacterium]